MSSIRGILSTNIYMASLLLLAAADPMRKATIDSPP